MSVENERMVVSKRLNVDGVAMAVEAATGGSGGGGASGIAFKEKN